MIVIAHFKLARGYCRHHAAIVNRCGQELGFAGLCLTLASGERGHKIAEAFVRHANIHLARIDARHFEPAGNHHRIATHIIDEDLAAGRRALHYQNEARVRGKTRAHNYVHNRRDHREYQHTAEQHPLRAAWLWL